MNGPAFLKAHHHARPLIPNLLIQLPIPDHQVSWSNNQSNSGCHNQTRGYGLCGWISLP